MVITLRVFILTVLVALTSTCHTAAQQPLRTSATTTKVALPAATATPESLNLPLAEALDQLMKALQEAQRAASFRAQLKSQINEDEADDLSLEIVAPDRRRIKGHNLDVIIIGDEGYLSFGSKWQKAPRDPQAKSTVVSVAQAPVFWGLAENDVARAAITIKTVTATTLDDKAATLFEYEMKDAFGKTGMATLRTWVTRADGLPRKTEMTGEYEGRRSKATLTWVEYNAALAIEAPALDLK